MLDPSAIITGYGTEEEDAARAVAEAEAEQPQKEEEVTENEAANNETMSEEESTEEEVEFTDDELTCYYVHERQCPSRPPHPLIKYKMYYDFYAEYETMIAEHIVAKSPNDPA